MLDNTTPATSYEKQHLGSYNTFKAHVDLPDKRAMILGKRNGSERNWFGNKKKKKWKGFPSPWSDFSYFLLCLQ